MKETLLQLKRINYKNFEVVLLPDEQSKISFLDEVKPNYLFTIIPTGNVSPAIKRDIGAEKCDGEVLAFIDDDAFPKPDWLQYVIHHFREENVCAVGGPQLTPETDSFSQKVSGAVFLSPFNGDTVKRYWSVGESVEVDDWPTVNLLVRKKDFLKVGGFDNSFYPGEDTKLCLDLVQKLNKKIVYEPKAIVFHHRRSGFFRHLKQIGRYGLHRGYFAKKYPETSFRLQYLLPSVFSMCVIFGWILGIYFVYLLYFYIFCIGVYLIGLLYSSWSIYKKIKTPLVALCSLPYVLGTHVFYGIQFIRGYFKKDLQSKLGR